MTEITLWVITHDHLEAERVGYGQTLTNARDTVESFQYIIGRTHYVTDGLSAETIPAEWRVRFRLLDDDREPCFDGVCDGRIITGEIGDEYGEDLGYNIDSFGMDDVGATIGLYNAADLRRCGASGTSDTDEWVVIYG